MPQLSANDQSKFQASDATVTRMRKKLQSYGVNFSTKKSSGGKIANETLFPSTPEEEMEQLSMATKLSSMALTSKMSHLLPMTLQQTLLPVPVSQEILPQFRHGFRGLVQSFQQVVECTKGKAIHFAKNQKNEIKTLLKRNKTGVNRKSV